MCVFGLVRMYWINHGFGCLSNVRMNVLSNIWNGINVHVLVHSSIFINLDLVYLGYADGVILVWILIRPGKLDYLFLIHKIWIPMSINTQDVVLLDPLKIFKRFAQPIEDFPELVLESNHTCLLLMPLLSSLVIWFDFYLNSNIRHCCSSIQECT